MCKFYLYLFALYLGLNNGYCSIIPQYDLSWDLLLFVQHWPETVCKIYLAKNASNSCNFPIKENAWSIHGIWPTKFGTIGPAWCNKTWKFEPEIIKSIEDDLNQDWIDIHRESPAYEFWGIEWEKHGTCSVSVDDLNTEYKYFDQALTWFKKYPMAEILNEANMIPSDTIEYQVKDFNQAILNILRVKPVIECYKDQGIQYIVELRICFDKSLNLKDCTGVLGDSAMITNCDVTQGVIFPPISNQLDL